MLPSTILQKRQLIAETVYRNVSPHGSNEFDSRQLKPCVPPADAVERPATRLSHATRALLSAALLSSAMSIVNCAGARTTSSVRVCAGANADYPGHSDTSAVADQRRDAATDSPGCGGTSAEEQSADFCFPLAGAGLEAGHAGSEVRLLPEPVWKPYGGQA